MPDLEPITRTEKLWSGKDLDPVTRKEMYIKHLYDETQVIPDHPVTREEMFILKAGEELHDVTIEQLTATENGTYSEQGVAYSPVIVEVPEPTLITKSITENGTYSAEDDNADGYSSVDVNVPLPENAYLLKSVTTPTPIASFNDGEEMVMPTLKAAIEPQQDLHGYDAPWVGGAGKNKFYMSNENEFKGYLDSTKIVANQGHTCYYFPCNTNTTYTVSKTATKTNGRLGIAYSYEVPQNNTSIYGVQAKSSGFVVGQRASLTTTTDADAQYIIVWAYWGEDEDSKNSIQLEIGSTATAYAPYSNICPITGYTEENVGVVGKNLFDKATNVLNGYMTSDGTFKASNSGEKTFYCKVPKGTITMGKPVGTSVLRGVLFDEIPSNNDVGYTVLQYESNAKQTFTTTKETYYVCYCYNNTGETNTWQAVLDSIQVEIGDTPTTYEPYNGHTYTIDLDGTRYGVDLDVINGIGREYKEYPSYNGETLIGPWISDRDVYAEGTTPTIGAQVLDKGDITTFSVTPTAIKSLRGVNNVWANTGDITDAEYFSKEV